MPSSTILPTSFLYVPGIKPHYFVSALASAAGAVILDLEDSVLPADKPQARENLRNFLAETSEPGKEIWVRVNALRQGEEVRNDIAALRGSSVMGIIVPKIELESFVQLDQEIRTDSRLRGLKVIGLVETAVGLLDVVALTRMHTIAALGLGRVDLFADLRIEVAEESESVFDALALNIVIASAAAGIAAPIAPVALAVNDPASADRSRHYLRRGFRSQTAIHPSQCAEINTIYTPSAEQYRAADAMVRAFAESDGTFVTPDGQFVDEAVVRHARETCVRYLALTAPRPLTTAKVNPTP